MSYLENTILDLLEKKGEPFNWLADKIGYSRQGLKNGLVNKTIKFESLEKIADVLNVPVQVLIEKPSEIQTVDITEFYSNRIVKLSVNRYSKLSDKLNYLKDIYIGEIIWKIKNHLIPTYPFSLPDKPANLLNSHEEIQYFVTLSNLAIDTPFSKMNDNIKDYLSGLKYLQEGFYYPVFFLNLYSITEYLSDEVLLDTELIYYWQSWQAVKDKLNSCNWPLFT